MKTSPRLTASVRLLLAFVAGLLFIWPWMDPRIFVAPWLGAALLIGLCHQQPAYRAFRYCFLAGMAFELVGFAWYPDVAAHILQVSWFSGLMVVLMVFAWDAFRLAMAGWLVTLLKPRADHAILVWPITWVSMEWAWPHIFPWRMGQSQMGWLPVLQVSEFAGVYGVTFLIIWAAACAAILWQHRQNTLESPDVRRGIRRQTGLCAACLMAAVVWGQWRIGNVEQMAEAQPHLDVALLQPGDEGDQQNYLKSESERVDDEVALIIWPESTASNYSLRLTSFHDPVEVAAHSDAGGSRQQPVPKVRCHVLLNGGSFPHESPQAGPFRNTSFLVDDHLQIVGRYHKRVLMPWGEYVVGQHKIPGLQDLLGGFAEYIPGTDSEPLSLPTGAKPGLLTCYEDLIDSSARQSCLAGANLLINQSNLSAFGRSRALWGHQQIGFIRAVETRRTFLRCGITGSTAVFSPTGRRLQQAPPHVSATLIASVPLLDTPTFFVLWGNVFAESCAVLCGLLLGRKLIFGASRGASKKAADECQQQQTGR